MKLRVQYTAQLRTAAGRSEEEIELPDGSSLAALLAHLVTRLGPDAASYLVMPGGQLPPSLLVVVNDTAVPPHQSDATMLRSGTVVTLLPPIAGG